MAGQIRITPDEMRTRATPIFDTCKRKNLP